MSTKRTRRTRQKNRPYRLIGFKAFFDTDRPIIDWWDDEQNRQRSEKLREIVRSHLMPEDDDELADLSAEVAVTREAIESMSRTIATQSRQIADLSGQLATAVQYLEGLAQQLAQGMFTPPPPPPEPERQRLTDEAVEERRNKLNKRSW